MKNLEESKKVRSFAVSFMTTRWVCVGIGLDRTVPGLSSDSLFLFYAFPEILVEVPLEIIYHCTVTILSLASVLVRICTERLPIFSFFQPHHLQFHWKWVNLCAENRCLLSTASIISWKNTIFALNLTTTYYKRIWNTLYDSANRKGQRGD